MRAPELMNASNFRDPRGALSAFPEFDLNDIVECTALIRWV